MIEQATPACALGLDVATLSALRDDALPADEAARIREHVAECDACRQRLDDFEAVAQAVRTQRELEPGDRIWPGVRDGAARIPAGARAWGALVVSRPAWRGLAAVASLALVVGLLAAVLASAQGSRGGGITAKPTQPIPTEFLKPTFAPTATPAFPTPTLPPTSSAISAAQAWGPNAATMTLNTHLDAAHDFWATAISPDGGTLLGVRTTAASGNGQPSGEAGIFTLANRQFAGLGVSQTPFYAVRCCQTDGRYLLIGYDTAPGTTCGSCHFTYYSYDLQTRSLWQMGRIMDLGGAPVGIDHGLVLLGTGQGFSVANPATHSITPVHLSVTSDQMLILAYTWPYVIYDVPQPGSTPGTVMLRAYNLSSGADAALAHLDNLQASYGLGVAVAGDTLFVTQEVYYDPQTEAGVTSLFEDDSFSSSGATPRLLASYADRLYMVAANSRIVNLGGGLV
jgi:hypothetical protein